MFKDDDILEVYFGYGYEIDENQEYLGQAPYYQGVTRIINDKLDELGVKCHYMRVVGINYGAFVDFGSHVKFFKLRKVGVK